jgi:mycothiol system anti-sigma-R factor
VSCGDPHEVNCAKILDAVYLYLDGECGHDQKALIRTHLDECSPCLREFGVEHDVKILIARGCGGDRAPNALRLSVLARLRAARAEAAASEPRPD